MRNLVLYHERTLINEVKTISVENDFSVYLVGSQLNESIISKDINLIAVMKNDSFKENFNMDYSEVLERFSTSDYSDINLIKYIAINNQLQIRLKFKTQLKLTFKLVDENGFDFSRPYLRIDNKKYDKVRRK